MAHQNPSTLLSLSRHQAHLETHIQTLLDAQSTGLLSGLGHDVPLSSTGTSTPTHSPARSYHAGSQSKTLSPSRRPPSKPLTLHTARRALSRAIADLAALKSQEGDILQSELEERRQDVAHIDSLISKQEGLKDAINTISNEETSHRLHEFRSEEQTLGHEILELEERLQQMRNRQRFLLREISGLENRTQAKLSSYRESLRLAEREAREWLARPPARVENYQGDKDREEDGMWALPKERRTLEMAREWAVSEEGEWRAKVEGCEKEREALEEGAEVWRDVRDTVERVERVLREEMSMQASRRRGSDEDGESMKRILSTMESARGEMKKKLTLAEDKGWRLLVCCVGAELEALVEGMGVLRGALDVAKGRAGNGEGYLGEDRTHGDDIEGDLLGETNGLDEMRQSMNGVSITKNRPRDKTMQRSEDEDDGPGPDLLISHQEEE